MNTAAESARPARESLSKKRPTAASVYAISPSYGAFAYVVLNGSGGVYGECGSKRCSQANTGWDSCSPIHAAAASTTSSALRSTAVDRFKKSSSYRSNPRERPDEDRKGKPLMKAPVA